MPKPFTSPSPRPSRTEFLKSLTGMVSVTIFVPVLAVFVLSSFFIFQAYRMGSRDQVVQSFRQIFILNSQGAKTILDQESSLRGYLLTGDAGYLGSFDRNVTSVKEALRQLDDAVDSNLEQKRRVSSIRENYRQWLEKADALRKMRRTGGPYASSPLNWQSRELMDRIRSDYREVRNREMNLLHDEETLTEQSMRRFLVTGGALSILLASGLAWFFQRRLSRQYRATLAIARRADFLSQQLSTIIEAAPVAIVYIDAAERYVFTNRYYQTHFGRGTDLVGRKVREVIGEDSYANVKPSFEAALSGKVSQIETEIVRPDGSAIQIRATYAPCYDTEGKIDGFVAISEDVSDRKEAAERLTFALQSGRMGTWDLDLKTRTVSCSKEMLDLWEVSQAEFEGERRSLQSKVHPDDVRKMNEAIEAAILSGTIYEHEYRILPSPGVVRWVASRGRCFYAGDSKSPTRLTGVVFDITDRKAKEEELRAAIQTRDQFLSIASHELKTPLTSLQLQLQLRQRDLKKNFPEAFTLEKIEKGLADQLHYVRRIAQLVDDILDVTRISNGKLNLQFESFDLYEMVSDVLERFRGTASSKKVELVLDDSESIVGNWDRFRMEQVVLNLLTNALRYGNQKPIRVQVSAEDRHAAIRVTDEGMGISERDHERIFQRFERAASEKTVGGLGLGLYISNEIVRAHAGAIRLKSEPGKGSEFTVVVPRDITGWPSRTPC